jgi:hypothetical protein
MDKWREFTSLSWYDAFIEFLFRFVAKTSEPLLAAGLTISAADYLSHGAVMAGHPAFALGWAWAQALALESSSGVVFVYALSAFRQTDRLKGAIYLALALMLAVVGGGMLLLQVNAVTSGSVESAVPVLNVLRVIVSIAYIFLLRAKSIRFSDLQDTSVQPALAPDVVNVLVEKLEHLTVTVNQLTTNAPPALPEHAENRQEISEPIYPSQFTSKEQEIAAVLAQRPDASVQEVAQAANCSERTAEKWMTRLTDKGDEYYGKSIRVSDE